MKELMTSAEAAELIGVNVKTIRRWLGDGKLSGANIPGAGWRITPADIDAFLAAHRPHKPPMMLVEPPQEYHQEQTP